MPVSRSGGSAKRRDLCGFQVPILELSGTDLAATGGRSKQPAGDSRYQYRLAAGDYINLVGVFEKLKLPAAKLVTSARTEGQLWV
jgi:hypothetical protein